MWIFIFLMPVDNCHFWLTRPVCYLHYKGRWVGSLSSYVTLAGAALNLAFFIFFLTFISGRKHLLRSLLSLEGIMLMLFGIICWFNSYGFGFFYYAIVFLTFMACEGALALSLLVVVVRWWGGDRTIALSLLQGN